MLTEKPVQHECQNCGKLHDEDSLVAIRDIFERVAPGEPMPSGECADCGALCHPAMTADEKERHAKLIEIARREYQSDEVEVDDNAKLSETDDGAWVAAWVWVANTEEESEAA